MWSNRQKMHDADAERAKQNLPEPTGLWRVPGAHVAGPWEPLSETASEAWVRVRAAFEDG